VRRMLYCPNEDMLKEATNITKLNFMQIQIGESGATGDLDFDRGSICVVEIPESRFVEYKQDVTIGLHQIFNYHNDFFVMNKSLCVLVNGEKTTPIMMEKHYAKFIFVCDEPGTFIAEIILNEEILESVEFNVG
jgi:hypothetical protein